MNNNPLSAILGILGNGKISDTITDWIITNPNVVSVAKSINWDLYDAKETLTEVFEIAKKRFSERKPFSKTIEERLEATKRNFVEMLGYDCLNDTEKKMLSASLSGFNANEIKSYLDEAKNLSVEQVTQAIDVAYDKFSKATKLAGVGMSKNGIEQSQSIDFSKAFSVQK